MKSESAYALATMPVPKGATDEDLAQSRDCISTLEGISMGENGIVWACIAVGILAVIGMVLAHLNII